MTTLPQTTTLRLPRPAAPAPLSIPGAAPVAMLAGQNNAAQMTPGDVLRVLRSNAWLIILSLIVSSVAGYYLNEWLKNHYSAYTAVGLIEIRPVVMADPVAGSYAGMDLNMLGVEERKQAQLLHEQTLFTQVIRDSDKVRDTDWFREFANDPRGQVQAAEADLLSSVAVAPRNDSMLLQVSMTCGKPGDAKTIVEEIVEQHIMNQEQKNRSDKQDETVSLNARKNRYDVELNDIRADMRTKATRLNISDDAEGEFRGGIIDAKNRELADAFSRQSEAKVSLDNASSQLENVTAQLAAGNDPPEVSQRVEADPHVSQLRSYLDDTDMQLSDTANLGEDNEQVKMLHARHDAFEQKLADARATAKIAAENQVHDYYKGQVDSYAQAVKTIQSQIDMIGRDLNDLSATMQAYLDDKDKERSISVMSKQVDNELDQIKTIEQQRSLSGIAWAAPPAVPDQPSFPVLKVTMMFSILVGLALSLGIAFTRELLDTTVRSPRDITRVGSMNLLGMVPHEDDDPQSAGASLPLVIFEAPHSMMAEQLRQVRTRLQHASSLDTTRSILVTSPGPEDGKSTIACNLASGLALNGRRILLVDANFRRPQLHRIFSLANDAGFSDVLNSLDEFETAVQETAVPNLYVLPSGLKPTNATELLESQLFIDFVERALEEFDHVIFDSGPLLFVSESVALAPRVDGVITVVRARINSRGVLQRMRDTLRQVKAEHLGVVLNAVRTQGGGYYGRNIRTYYAYQNGRVA